MTSTTCPHVAIALLNFNGRPLLEEYLPSIMAVSYPNFSVWVIDNASSDDSEIWLQTNYPKVKVVQNGSNLGYAEGYNVGLQAIKADYYLLLNNDVEVNPGFLQPMVNAMEANPNIALAQPKLRWLRKPEYFEYAGAAGGLIDRLGYPFCRGRFFDQLEKDIGQYNLNCEVFWASGACLLVKTKIFWQLGGFYSYFFMHSEEIDLAWRAQNAGYKVLAVGNSSVMHLGAASLGKTNPMKTYYNFRNNLVMCLRNAPITHLLFLLWARFGLDALAALSFALKRQWSNANAVIKAWKAVLHWWFSVNDPNKWPEKRGMSKLKGYAGRFIVLDYYIKKCRK